MQPQHGSREHKYDAERRSANHHRARNPARWPERLRRGKGMSHLVPYLLRSLEGQMRPAGLLLAQIKPATGPGKRRNHGSHHVMLNWKW